jgi:hypothetical protein
MGNHEAACIVSFRLCSICLCSSKQGKHRVDGVSGHSDQCIELWHRALGIGKSYRLCSMLMKIVASF